MTLQTSSCFKIKLQFVGWEDKHKDSFIDPQKFVVEYSTSPEQPQSSVGLYMSFSHYDEHGARTSHQMHCCI